MAVTAAEIRAILTLQDQLSGQLSKVQGELHKLGASAGSAGNAARAAGPSWASMSTAIAAGTVAANAFMAVAQKTIGLLTSAGAAATDFGDSMAATRSKLSTAEWDQYGAALENNALRLGKDFPLSASEAAKAQDLLIAKGLTAKQVLEGGADSVVRLASATGADLLTATAITAAAMDTFNVDAADMNRVTNLITGTMIRAGVSATDYGFAMKSAGAVVKLAGGSIDDLSLAIAAMAKAGIEGSDAGTSLKTMYSNLQPTTKAQIKTMLELGLITKDGANAFYDSSGKVKSYEEISRILAKSLEGLTEQQQQMALETMFGSDAIRAAAVSAKLGRGEFGELKKELASVDADEVAQKRMDSLAGSLKQFGGSAETVGIVLLSKLGPGMKTIIDTGTELLNSVLTQLETPAAAAFFETMGQGAAQLGNDLYAAGQSASEFGASLNGIPTVGATLDALFQAAGSSLVALAAIMRGDAKGAAEATANAFGSLLTAAGTIGQEIAAVAETIATAAQKAGDTGGWGALQNSLGNLQQTFEFVGDRFNELGATFDRVAAASGVTMRPIDALAVIIRGAAQGFEYATVMLDGWIDGALSGINIATNFAVGLSSLGTAMRALATGDTDLLRNSVVDAREAFAAGITAAEEYRARGLERVAAQATITAQMVGDGMSQVQASTETSMGAAAAAAEASMADIEASAQTHAAGAVAAVEGQAGAASAAGAAVGSNLGAGLVDGLLGWLGRVRAAAAQMVGEAIGAGNVEGEIRSPSERTRQTGRMLAAGVAEGIDELSPQVQARMRDMIDAAASYAPVAGEIKRVEGEIAAVRQRGQTDALFRAKEMITIDSEALRLKKEMAIAERDMLPVRQALARASREVENISRGSLGDRQNLIGMDGERKEIRLQIIDLEKQLIGLDSDSKKAESIKKQIDRLQDQDRLLSLEAERIGLTNEVAATGARIKREALDDQVRGQEDATAGLREQIAVLGAEQSVFQALEAIIKNALDNEIAERERLIAVFRAEAQPILDRIQAGLAYVDQLEAEGVLTKEQADKLREVGKNLDIATRGTEGLGKAAEASAPQIDAATKKAEEMAAAGAKIAGSYDKAANKVKELGDTIGKVNTPLKDLGAFPKARARALGGPVVPNDLYLVGERGPELFVPDSAGAILPADATAAMLDGSSGGSTGRGSTAGGREIHLHMEGARIYGFSDFEGAVQSVVAKGLKRGQFGR